MHARARRRMPTQAGILTAWLVWGCLPTAWGMPPMPTRLVALFGGRERALADAMASGDLQAIDALVSRDFEARPGDAPGHPVPRGSWLQGSPAAQFPGRIEQLAVRAVGPAALVSFVWVLPAGAGRVSVVDLWDGTDENSHLLTRYATPLGSTALRQGQPEASGRRKQ